MKPSEHAYRYKVDNYNNRNDYSQILSLRSIFILVLVLSRVITAAALCLRIHSLAFRGLSSESGADGTFQVISFELTSVEEA